MSDPGQMTQGKPPSYRIMENRISELIGEIATLRQQLAEAKARSDKFQSERAKLFDQLNGTPCAQIRWEQERERLSQQLAEAREAAIEECLLVVESEPEFPGDPDDVTVEAMRKVGEIKNARAACRATKRAIATALRALKEQARDMTTDESREMERQTRELDAEIAAVLNADESGGE